MYTLNISLVHERIPYAGLVASYYFKTSFANGSDLTINVLTAADQPKAACSLSPDEPDAVPIMDEADIVRFLCKGKHGKEEAAQQSAMIALAGSLGSKDDFSLLTATLDTLDDRLALRTFFGGHEPTAADWVLYGALKGSLKPLGIMKGGKHPHLLRWFNYIEGLPSTQSALADVASAKTRNVKAEKAGTASSFQLGLPDAVQGRVVTRFPPEPSGYLHIGHLKAAILNEYFARMYGGRLIVRFDDTNPMKEKSEFEQSILEDLASMGIQPDMVSHTSDYFDHIYDMIVKMIKSGKAYVDDTDRETMQDQRWNGIASVSRDISLEENLRRFAEMEKATEEGKKYCVRAKLSVDDPNKAMRDPVLYRCVAEEHHRTGGKWKIYPTYDFACPVVDSLEGVTHALRTNEYRDRNPQYQWMLEALGIRKVFIWDFSRIAFVYTFLSKRMLRECLELGLAKGWDDPRFPTYRGIRRRGMTVEALRQFMLAQGPSQNQVLLEWDSIWTINKKFIDPIAPRFCAINKDKMVIVTMKGGPPNPEIITVPKHKKNPDVGIKKTVLASEIVVEQDDAITFAENEEITLMDWGNAYVRAITRAPSGEVTHIDMELHLSGDVKTTSKKITWLASASASPSSSPLVPVILRDYDYLITKRKLEKDDKSIASIVNSNTEFVTQALADANVKELRKADIIQFERKGYYIVDAVASDGLELVHIPDGRAAGLALKSGLAGKDGKVQQNGSAGKATGKEGEESAATIMYKVDPISAGDVTFETDTKMYKVDPIAGV